MHQVINTKYLDDFKEKTYNIIKQQIQRGDFGNLSPAEYQAVIKKLCDILNY